MSGGLRLLFDECCSRKLARELGEFYRVDYPGLEIAHVLDAYARGTDDPDWLAPLRGDRSWIVITKDVGSKSPRHKLPLICREWGITHVALTAALINAGFTAHKNALVAVWPQLFFLSRLPPGTQVKLGFRHLVGAPPAYELRVAGKSLASALAAMDKNGPDSHSATDQ